MRVLITDDHPMFRAGVKSLLQTIYRELFVLEASNGREALEIISANPIDILFLDLSMPVMDGWELLLHFKKIRSRNFKIIVLSLYNDEIAIHYMLELKVDGYLPKNFNADELIHAIEQVLNNEIYFPEKFDSKIRKLIHSGRLPSLNISNKEKEIIRLLSEGKTSKEISLSLGYTVRTVETKHHRLEKKLFVKSSTELVSLAFKLGYLQPNGDK